jgi:uncharacterized protein
MRLHERFEWDRAKADANLRKHGVSFGDAQVVLSDEEADFFHIDEYDDEHSVEEDRFLTTASDPFKRSRVLIVSWTERQDEQGRVTRIISARAANPRERREYESQLGHNL